MGFGVFFWFVRYLGVVGNRVDDVIVRLLFLVVFDEEGVFYFVVLYLGDLGGIWLGS